MKAKLIVKNAVRSEHRAGRTQKSIAKKYDLPLRMVREYMKEDKGAEKMKKHNKQDLIETITTERLEGMSLRQIAEEHELSQKTIRNYLGEANVRLEKPDREARKVAAVRKFKNGKTREEIADELNISYASVMDYIREDRMENSETEIYKEIGTFGRHKREIRKWAADQAGKYLNTPDGSKLVLEAYPNFLLFHEKWGSTSGKVTFTTAEIYYMNERRK